MEEAKIKKQLNIMHALVDEELEDYFKIQKQTRIDICRITGCEEREIDVIIRNYEQVLGVHGWLRKQKEKDLPIPKSSQEMIERMGGNPHRIKSYFNEKDKRTHYTADDRKKVKKWGYSGLKVIHIR